MCEIRTGLLGTQQPDSLFLCSPQKGILLPPPGPCCFSCGTSSMLEQPLHPYSTAPGANQSRRRWVLTAPLNPNSSHCSTVAEPVPEAALAPTVPKWGRHKLPVPAPVGGLKCTLLLQGSNRVSPSAHGLELWI